MAQSGTRNYLIIIGMDMSSKPTTASVQAALEKAREQWRILGYRDSYYMQLCDEYKTMMAFAQDQQQIDEAYHKAKEVIDDLLHAELKIVVQILGAQALPSSQLSSLEKRVNRKIDRANSSKGYTLTDDYVLSFSKDMGITWTESSVAAIPSNNYAEEKAIAERYTKAKDEYKLFNTPAVKAALTNQGFKDLFDFACPTDRSDGRQATNQELLAQARAMKAAQKKPSAQVATDMTFLEKVAERAFASDQSRRDYEGYLRWLSLTEYLKETTQRYADLGVSVTVADQCRIEETLTKMGLVKPSDTHALLVGYCAARKPKPIRLEGYVE